MATRHTDMLLRHIRKLAAAHTNELVPDRELLGRFATQHDEAAFEALVRRHGPMVLRVCRRVLGHLQDAEDVFQATFIVLARQAASRRWHESVGNWLYGVSYRLALEAKRAAARRSKHESRAGQRLAPDPVAEITLGETLVLLDEELSRLPERYRAPLVLCCLEGRTRDEAAKQLGWSLGTLKRRLEQGRGRLHDRLVRRGLSLSSALAALSLTQGEAPAARLVESTLKAAVASAAGKAAAGVISTHVVALVNATLNAIFLTKAKIATAIVFAVGLAAAGTGLALHQASAAKEGAETLGAAWRKPVTERADPSEPAGDMQARTDRYGVAPTLRQDDAVPKIRAKLQGHAGSAYCVAFSPDGRVLASGGKDRTVKLWEVATGKLTATLEGHAGSVWTLALSPDGKILVAGSGRFDPPSQKYLFGELKVWDLAQREATQTLQGHAKMVNALAFSPDGKLLASASDDTTVKLWDVAAGQVILRQVVYDSRVTPPRFRSRQPPDAVSSVAFSPDGKLLAWGDSYYAITLWDVGARQEKARMEGHAGAIRSVVFSPDGTMLASSGNDWSKGGVCIKLWEVLTAKERASFDFTYKQSSCFHSAAFGRTGRMLISGSNNGVVKRWDLAAGKDMILLDDGNNAVYSVKFSPDGAILAAARSDGSLVLWDMAAVAARQPRPQDRPDAATMTAAWDDLASADAKAAYRALRLLVEAPQQSLPLLRERLRPAPAPEPKQIKRWLAALDSGRFAERERAMRELERQGDQTAAALRRFLAGGLSPEARQRAEALLARLDGPITDLQRLRALRAVEALEHIGTREAQQVLETLTKGATDARLTREAKASLQRLAKRPAFTP